MIHSVFYQKNVVEKKSKAKIFILLHVKLFVLLWNQNVMIKITNIQITIITIWLILSAFSTKRRKNIFDMYIQFDSKKDISFAIILSHIYNHIPSFLYCNIVEKELHV